MPAIPEVLTPLSPEELRKMDAYWRACNYLSAAMIYLRANPLLRMPLEPKHIRTGCSATGAPIQANPLFGCT